MKIKNLTLISLFTALIVVGTFIRIPLPLCPITLQPFFVILSGLMLGAKSGCASVALYLALGLVGLPVFSSGGGIGYVFQPTFGFMIGFFFGALLAGYIAKGEKTSFLRYVAAGISGLVLVYVIGVIYFYLITRFYLTRDTSFGAIFASCVLLPFPKDAALCVLAALVAKRLAPHIRAFREK